MEVGKKGKKKNQKKKGRKEKSIKQGYKNLLNKYLLKNRWLILVLVTLPEGFPVTAVLALYVLKEASIKTKNHHLLS